MADEMFMKKGEWYETYIKYVRPDINRRDEMVVSVRCDVQAVTTHRAEEKFKRFFKENYRTGRFLYFCDKDGKKCRPWPRSRP